MQEGAMSPLSRRAFSAGGRHRSLSGLGRQQIPPQNKLRQHLVREGTRPPKDRWPGVQSKFSNRPETQPDINVTKSTSLSTRPGVVSGRNVPQLLHVIQNGKDVDVTCASERETPNHFSEPSLSI